MDKGSCNAEYDRVIPRKPASVRIFDGLRCPIVAKWLGYEERNREESSSIADGASRFYRSLCYSTLEGKFDFPIQTKRDLERVVAAS